MSYNTKVLETPNKIEVWNYKEPIYQNPFPKEDEETRKRRRYEELNRKEKAKALKRRQKYYENKKNEIRRLIECNYDENTKFLTLTQDPKLPYYFSDNIDQANHYFTNFIKRLKYYINKNCSKKFHDFKYIATREYQKNGNIHYHLVLFNFPYIDADKMAKLWKCGFIKINQIPESVEAYNIGVYISKYFSKDFDLKALNKKAFFTSRNLKRPDEYKLFIDDFSEELFGEPTYKKTYQRKTYEDKVNYHMSDVDYYVYNKDVLINKEDRKGEDE